MAVVKKKFLEEEFGRNWILKTLLKYIFVSVVPLAENFVVPLLCSQLIVSPAYVIVLKKVFLSKTIKLP